MRSRPSTGVPYFRTPQRVRAALEQLTAPWRFHFYRITGVIPRAGDTIETAWERLSRRMLWDAACWLCPPELWTWMDLHYGFTQPRRRGKMRVRSLPRLTADAIRELLPVPDAGDLATAVARPFESPWVLVPSARREVEREEKRQEREHRAKYKKERRRKNKPRRRSR